MPNLRKRSSVLTYNDDAVFRAIENLRKFKKSGNKSSKAKTFVKRDNIPEVVYADDGRQFFPCYFCCSAFAFKHDQLSHMQQCNFRVAVAPEPPSVQVNVNRNKTQPKVAPRLQSTNTSTKAVMNKAQPRGIVKVKHKIQNGLVKSSIFPNPASAKATNKIQSGLLVPTTFIKVEPNAIQSVALKQNIVKKVAPKKLPNLPKSGSMKLEPNAIQGVLKQNIVKKVASKKLPNLPKSGLMKLEPNAIQGVLKQIIVKKATPKKLPNLPKSGPPVILPNPPVKPKLKSTSILNKKVTVKARNNNIFKANATLQGFKRQEVSAVQKVTSNKFTFPKIKLGQHVESAKPEAKPKGPKVFNNEPSNCCMHCGEVFESQTKLAQHKREKHTYPRIFVPSDKLKEYDEMYKQSDMSECTICHKPIAKTYWKRHLQTHTGEKNYFCSICNKPFGRKDHRDIHERNHIVDLMKNFGS